MDTLVAVLQPRDHRVAGRMVSVLSLVACGVIVLFAGIQLAGSGPAPVVVTISIACIVGSAGWRVRYLSEMHRYAWAVLPFVTILVIVVLDFVTADGSLAAQVFFFFPILYGAAHLRRHGATAVTAGAMIGELVVVLGLLPPAEAVVSFGYVGAAIITTVVLLVASGERQDELVNRLSLQAAVDPLTGLVTRRVLDQAAQSALSGAASRDGTALMLIDVDGFKKINDTFGHPGGDEVLVQLGRVLVGVCRPTDVVSRLGGDEIALLLLGCSSSAMFERAQQIFDRIRLTSFAIDESRHINVTVSAGLAHAPTHAGDLRKLYLVADEALYRAKRAGRNQFAGPVPPAPEVKDRSSRRAS